MKRNTFTAILVLALVLIMGTALVSCKNEPKLPIAPTEIVDHVVGETVYSFLTCKKSIDAEAAGTMTPEEIDSKMEAALKETYANHWKLEKENRAETT